VHDRPAHKAVDRDRRVSPDVRLINALNVAAFGMKHETSNSGVGNQHIRTAAEYRDRNGSLVCEFERHDGFIAAARLEEPVSGPADPEGRKGAERHIAPHALLTEAMPVLKPRAKDLIELADGAAFLFKVRPLDLTEQAQALLSTDAKALLARISARLLGEQDWTTAALEANLKAYADEQGLGLGKLAQPLRAALTGQTTSPGIFDVLALLGKEESLARIDAQTAG